MPTKNERVELRLAADLITLIRTAAEALNETISEFIRKAAAERAERVLTRNVSRTLMPAAQFDAIMNSLDIPEPAPYLVKAAAKPRAFERR